jgi:hypothetical protein
MLSESQTAESLEREVERKEKTAEPRPENKPTDFVIKVGGVVPV